MEINNINKVNSVINKPTFENKENSKVGFSIKEKDLKTNEDKTKQSNFENKDSQKNDLQQKISKINENLNNQGLSLNYVKDEKTDRMVVQLKDMSTNEVIKQIPSKEMLQIADNIDKFLSGYNQKGNVNKSITDLAINLKV